MLFKKPLSEVINSFLSTVSKVSNKDNQMGFNVETTIEIVNVYDSYTFYRVREANNGNSTIIGLRLKNREKLLLSQHYNVFGYLELEYKNSNIYVNLIAQEIQAVNEIKEEPNPNIMDIIKQFPLQRREFPKKDFLNITLICPKKEDAEATTDIESKFESGNILDLISINKIRCSVTNAESVAEAIYSVPKDTDILILTRGGGDKSPIQWLDDELIAKALQGNSCYKMIGTGHASDRLAIEMLFDHISAVPADIATKIIDELTEKTKNDDITYENITLRQKLSDSGFVSKDLEIQKLKSNLTLANTQNNQHQSKIIELQTQINSLQNKPKPNFTNNQFVWILGIFAIVAIWVLLKVM